MLSAKAKAHVRSFDELVTAPEHRIYILVGEPEAEALRSGKVPESVQEQARAALDWAWQQAKTVKRKDVSA